MSTHKNIDRICCIVLVLMLVFTVLFMNGEKFGIEAVADEDAEGYEVSGYFTANDLNGAWDTAGATAIQLSGGSSTVSGSGAYVYGGDVYITTAGYYTVTGQLTDGSIIVDSTSASKVWILLDGAEITCSDDACIRVEQADKVFLTLADGTENVLESGAEYSEDALADGTDGVIFSHDDLTINGSGSLTIRAAYKHGIAANDTLAVTGGTISVEAAEDGLNANESLRITEADLTVQAGDDGIHSDTEIDILSGKILISECNEGIEAEHVSIAGGEITIYPADDGINAAGGDAAAAMQGGGMRGAGKIGAGMADAGMAGVPSGGMGMMATAVKGGAVTGGAGVPGNGTDGAGSTGSAENTLPSVEISGGTVTIINENGRDADGIDSNGSILISGGTVCVSVADSGGNCALDFGTTCEISGGTVIACGSSSMMENVSASSAQASLCYISGEGLPADTAIKLEDQSGNTLLAYTAPCSFSSVILSCPALEIGQTYSLLAGDRTEEITLTDRVTAAGDGQGGVSGGKMTFGGTDRQNGTEVPDGTETPDGGTEMPDGTETPDGGTMPGGGRPGKMGMAGGMPGGTEMPGETELPDGTEMPDRTDRHGKMDIAGGTELPDGTEQPDGMEMPGREDAQSGMVKIPDAAAAEAAGSGAGAPDGGQLILLGISIAVLAAGVAAALLYKKRV